MNFQEKHKINQQLETIEDEINEIMEKEGVCGKFSVLLSSLNEIRLTVNNLQKNCKSDDI
jgi:uncharacterized protein YhaN